MSRKEESLSFELALSLEGAERGEPGSLSSCFIALEFRDQVKQICEALGLGYIDVDPDENGKVPVSVQPSTIDGSKNRGVCIDFVGSRFGKKVHVQAFTKDARAYTAAQYNDTSKGTLCEILKHTAMYDEPLLFDSVRIITDDRRGGAYYKKKSGHEGSGFSEQQHLYNGQFIQALSTHARKIRDKALKAYTAANPSAAKTGLTEGQVEDILCSGQGKDFEDFENDFLDYANYYLANGYHRPPEGYTPPTEIVEKALSTAMNRTFKPAKPKQTRKPARRVKYDERFGVEAKD